MTAEDRRVVGLGLAVLDQLVIWQDTSVPVQDNEIIDTDMQGGGMAATAMVAVTRLGAQAELWTAIGDDWVGNEIINGLNMDHVDTSQTVRVENGRSLLVLVCIDHASGERYFKLTHKREDFKGEFGDLSRLQSADCLLIDHAWPASELKAAKEAQCLGVPVVSDTEFFNDWHPNIFPYIDYAIVSETCAHTIAPDLRDACRSIRQMGARCAIVTLGAEGLVCDNGQRYFHLPAFSAKVVDTTGAGDVFHGAFCYGLTQEYALEYNLRFSSAASAIKCGRIGGRAGIPTREQIEVFLGEHGFGS